MGRWVYRRPYFRTTHPKIPLFKRAQPVIRSRVRIKKVVRLRVRIRRRTTFVLGRVAAVAGVSPTFFRTARTARRPLCIKRRRLFRRATVPGPQATVGRVVRALRRKYPQRRRALRHIKRSTVSTKAPAVANNKTGPIWRFRKAVARMRRAMQARLRWKPRPEEIPPIIVTPLVRQTPKGRVVSPGAIRGRITGGGL